MNDLPGRNAEEAKAPQPVEPPLDERELQTGVRSPRRASVPGVIDGEGGSRSAALRFEGEPSAAT
jgi:hypothetical protein